MYNRLDYIYNRLIKPQKKRADNPRLEIKRMSVCYSQSDYLNNPKLITTTTTANSMRRSPFHQKATKETTGAGI
jgi:hypothetical protein